MRTLREFLAVYRLYRRGQHTRRYSVTTAWHIVVQGLPF
jgi:hypothetical protein